MLDGSGVLEYLESLKHFEDFETRIVRCLCGIRGIQLWKHSGVLKHLGLLNQVNLLEQSTLLMHSDVLVESVMLEAICSDTDSVETIEEKPCFFW